MLGLIVLVGGIVGGWWYLDKNTPKITDAVRPNKIRITNIADNKFSVSWITPTDNLGLIEYGPIGGNLVNQALDERDKEDNIPKEYSTHQVTVQDLQPNTQYFFRILSGKQKIKFDNNGSPYMVTTGPMIIETPIATSLYGEVTGGEFVGGTLVYVTLPGAVTASTLVKAAGNYTIALSTIRTSDLKKYIEYDKEATIATINLDNGKQQSNVMVSMINAAPVPTITLGQDEDFRMVEKNNIAQIEEATTPTVLNVEPFEAEVNQITQDTTEVVILNPTKDGEQIATTLPEFRGLGPTSTRLTIKIESMQVYTDTVSVATDGTWSWTPPTDLEEGEHTLTINYIDRLGITKMISRTFTVSKALAEAGDPAFETTPSASAKSSAMSSPSPASSMVATSSPRTYLPSTESGVPVTGVISPTLLTASLGFAIMILGTVMLLVL